MPRPHRRGAAVVVVALAILVLAAIGPASASASVTAPGSPSMPMAGDPVYDQGLQWSLGRIGAEAAWQRADGAGTTIAIVDSGVDLLHEDLRGQIVGSVSCIGAAGDPDRCSGSAQDDNGHGTHVAGIAAAASGNGRGIAGVAPGARLLAVRVLANECTSSGCTASGSASDVVAGIRWAVRQGADVINLSLGGGALQSTLGCAFCQAIEEAWAAGAIAVVAAGNDSILPSGFGDAPAVVVTATNRADRRASYSNTNSGVLRQARWPVAAPGGEPESDPANCSTGHQPDGILSTYWSADAPNAYACLAGTSMAAPHVSGALALLRSAGLSPQQAIDRLLATATDLGPAGRDSTFGAGRIDLARAVGQLPAPSGTTVPGTSSTIGGANATTRPTPPSTTPATDQDPSPTPPAVTTPDTATAAPFTPTEEAAPPPGPGHDEDRPPPWLVAVAIAALLAAAAATAGTAIRLEERS